MCGPVGEVRQVIELKIGSAINASFPKIAFELFIIMSPISDRTDADTVIVSFTGGVAKSLRRII